MLTTFLSLFGNYSKYLGWVILAGALALLGVGTVSLINSMKESAYNEGYNASQLAISEENKKYVDSQISVISDNLKTISDFKAKNQANYDNLVVELSKIGASNEQFKTTVSKINTNINCGANNAEYLKLLLNAFGSRPETSARISSTTETGN